MATPLPRDGLIARLAAPREWDLAVVGGGAVGLGVALDAAARGFSVVLLEAGDFAGGTSSRATKLAHGGVRYLAQGDLALVREALHERGALLANAPHVAAPLPFVMPAYRWWEKGFYGAGLKAYDLLAGARGLGPTEWLDAPRARALLPGARAHGPAGALQGGVRYWDGQFDDARLALLLARTAAGRGALLVNHAPVTALWHERGQLRGLVARDAETGTEHRVSARCVVNAAGVWVDRITALDHDAAAPAPEPAAHVAPSQGVHLVVDRGFLPGKHALLVPRTDDGRVLFAVPWLGKTVLGTTDTPRSDAPPGEHLYGTEAAALRALPGADRWLARDRETGAGVLSEAMVRFAVRHEFARSTADVLARRSRLLFLDAALAAEAAPAVAALVAEETGRDPALEAFAALAAQYRRLP